MFWITSKDAQGLNTLSRTKGFDNQRPTLRLDSFTSVCPEVSRKSSGIFFTRVPRAIRWVAVALASEEDVAGSQSRDLFSLEVAIRTAHRKKLTSCLALFCLTTFYVCISFHFLDVCVYITNCCFAAVCMFLERSLFLSGTM